MGICLKTIGNTPIPTIGTSRYRERTFEGDIVWLPENWVKYWRVIWEVADDFYDGLNDYLIKSLYLFQKPGEPDDAYTIRLISSDLDNHYRDAIDFYAGLLSQFEILEETPEELKDLFNNIDGAGNSLTVVSLQADKEILKKDSCLLFVDPPVADSEKKIPRLRIIDLRDIYSPVVEKIGNEYVMTQVCIRRSSMRRKGKYAVEYLEQYWMYQPGIVTIFESQRVDETQTKMIEVDKFEILNAAGERLNRVPAVWYSCGGGTPLAPETPPFHRLLKVNQKQLNKVSELDDAEMRVNTITPCLIYPDDVPDPAKPVRLGPNSAMVLGGGAQGMQALMLEAAGNGIALTHQRNQDRAEQMKELSRAFIGGRSTLTATEATQNDSRSKVNLQLVAHQKESTIQEVFKLMMEFMDPNFKYEEFEGGIKISDEALRAAVNAQDIKAIQDGYLNGSYSRRYMLEKLKEVGFQPEGIDIEDELNTLEEVVA
jgi:hypothetical protein